MDAHPPSRRPILRVAALLLACLGCFAAPAIAQADDLIQLNGDPPVTFGGNVNYGMLYLDGVVRLAGDTAITANDVFIGPDAQLQACYDIATNGNNCTTGRSLTINATGGVAIQPAIDLRGLVGANRAGGSLVIRAARVALGGGVETAGTNAQSGLISIVSPGLIVTQNLHAPGNGITVHGAAGVSIGGDVWSAGSDTATGSDPTRLTTGGAVDLASSGGDVSVLGAIASWGRDVSGAGPLAGGHGGSVNVVGGDVRISGGIDSRPGRGVDASAGLPGAIAISARGSIAISGPVDASGDASTGAFGSDGAAIAMTAAGGLTTSSINSLGGAGTTLGSGAGGNVTLTAGAALSAGAIATNGAGSPASGRHGGTVTVTAASVSLGSVTTDAGDATSDPANGSGERGGAVVIKATGNVGVGSVSAHGGSGRALGGGGPGGVVIISGDRVSTGAIATPGENLSAAGGSVTVAAQSGLLIGGPVDSSGAPGANGNPGGAAGSMLLSAAHGPLTLGGRLRAEGGTGAAGASGGSGGAIEIVVQSIASSTGVLSGGGNGGNAVTPGGPRGPGGNGGRVRIWSQLPSLILLQFVDSTGGTGDPNGADGPQQEEAAPTDFSISKTGALAFVTKSPDAEGYRVYASLAGAPAQLVMTAKASGAPVPKVPACIRADYTLSAFATAVGWQSDPIGPFTVMVPPSANQACTDAPQLTFGVRKLSKRLGALRKDKWRVKVRFLADGMGTAHAVLSRKSKKLVTADKALAAVRREVTMALTLPKKLRKPGKFTVTVTGSAPLGKARSKSTLTLEVKS